MKTATLVFILGSAICAAAVAEVQAQWAPTNLVWGRDDTIDSIIGPEDALYCKLENPAGVTISIGFGPCKLNIARVTDSDQGIWKVSLGQSGKITMTEQQFLVTVASSVNTKPKITTNFYEDGSSFVFTCSVVTSYPVKMCKFRDQVNRNVYIASQNATEGRYETFVSEQSSQHTCGLRINSVQSTDVGMWRCSIETEQEKYFAFQTLQSTSVEASVILKPIPFSLKPSTDAISGDEVTLSCAVNVPIRYCFFRKASGKNGTIIDVAPGYSTSSNVQYYGEGLDAGECGIKFLASTQDAGEWGCHVGYHVLEKQDKSMTLELNVAEMLTVDQYVSGTTLVIEGKVHNSRALDYCRFVRMDGYSMTSDRTWLPAGYEDFSSPSTGHCALHKSEPTILDHHSWIVVAKFKDQSLEVSKITGFSLTMPDSEDVPPGPSSSIWIWVMVAVSIVGVVVTASVLLFKRNRNMPFPRFGRNKHEEMKAPIPEHMYPEHIITEKNPKEFGVAA